MFNVLTVGSFTLLHTDHLRLIRKCRQLAGPDGRLVVGINSDDMVVNSKGFLPEFHDANRAALMFALKGVDEAYINYDNNILEQIKTHSITNLVVGGDWLYPKDYLLQIGCTQEDLWEQDCVLTFVPTMNEHHSSELRKGLV